MRIPPFQTTLYGFQISLHQWTRTATKETAESWRGNRHVAQQTTLSVEVAHFTQDEQNILHCGPTWLADKNHTTNTNSCQQAKSERGTHQNLNAARAK